MTPGKRGNWSVQELERLEVLFPRCSTDRVAELLGRSSSSVRRRATELFSRRGRRGRQPWSGGDDLTLRIAYGVQDTSNIALVLGRSEQEVAQRVEVLRGARRDGPWRRADINLLKQLYGSRSDEDLEVCLSRSRADIERAAREHCLCKDKRFLAQSQETKRVRMPRWTEREIERLAELYPEHGNLRIARELGRSVASVANKANQLRLKKSAALLERMGRDNVGIRYGR